tara:strand:- start:947 stop:1081 length:135 start_codon:yes stop_codon:yes gene_type:complete
MGSGLFDRFIYGKFSIEPDIDSLNDYKKKAGHKDRLSREIRIYF